MTKAPTGIALTTLLLAATGFAPCGTAGARLAEAGQGAPVVPQIIPVPGVRPSGCSLPEPSAGRLRTYPVPGADGIYAAYGDSRLLPVSIEVRIGEGTHPHGIDQLLFGAQTTFTLPSSARLFDQPRPVGSLGVPRQPMAVLYGATASQGTAPWTTAYHFPLTASVWEIAGQRQPGHAQPAACLYFGK